MTEIYHLGLIGHPVGHSLSPPMHNAALKYFDVGGSYELFDIAPSDFSNKIEHIKMLGVSGFNVTIPYKIAILEHCAYATEAVKRTGAANTVTIQNDFSLIADNTDIAGFSEAISNYLNRLNNVYDSACILGAGGACKAAIDVLITRGFRNIFILARRIAQAEEICRARRLSCSNVKLIPVSFKYSATICDAQLFVNTIPFVENVQNTQSTQACQNRKTEKTAQNSDSEIFDESFLTELFSKRGRTNALVFDMVYSRNGSPTKVIKLANRAGLESTDGTEMLIYQAKKAFEVWTGKKVPFAIMQKALYEARAQNLTLCNTEETY